MKKFKEYVHEGEELKEFIHERKKLIESVYKSKTIKEYVHERKKQKSLMTIAKLQLQECKYLETIGRKTSKLS